MMKYKINLLLKPFVLIQFAIIFISVFTHWLLIMKLGMFPGLSTLFSIAFSLILSLVVSFVYFKERFRVLNFRFLKSLNFHMLVLTVFLSIPAIFSQFYLVESNQKLKELNTISDLDANETVKYYSIKDFSIEKEEIGYYSFCDTKYSGNDVLKMHVYYSLPIISKNGKLDKNTCITYLGVGFHKEIKKNLSEKEHLKEYADFKNQCSKDLKHRDFGKVIYFEKIDSYKEMKVFNLAVDANKNLESTKIFARDNIFFAAKEESFSVRLYAILFCLICSLVIIFILFFFFIKGLKVNKKRRIEFDANHFSALQNFKFFFSFFYIREGYKMTPILLVLNILIFTLQYLFEFVFPISQMTSSMLTHTVSTTFTGVLDLVKLPFGMFMHFSLICLVINTIALALLGNFLEPLVGKKKMLSLYLQLGLFVAIGTYFMDMPFFIVGASNIILGFYCLAFYFMRSKVAKPTHSRIFKLMAFIFIAYNFIGLLDGTVDMIASIGVVVYTYIYAEKIKSKVLNKKIL